MYKKIKEENEIKSKEEESRERRRDFVKGNEREREQR